MFEYVRKRAPDRTLTVNSSPYAVPVYAKLGFVPTDREQVQSGIRYTPMIYKYIE
jgi:predicted GNAT family N-acyltransferase